MHPPTILIPLLALLRSGVRGVIGPLGFWTRRAQWMPWRREGDPVSDPAALLIQNWVRKRLEMIEALRDRLIAEANAPQSPEPIPDAIFPPGRVVERNRRRRQPRRPPERPATAGPDPTIAASLERRNPSKIPSPPDPPSVEAQAAATPFPRHRASGWGCFISFAEKRVLRTLETRAYFVAIS